MRLRNMRVLVTGGAGFIGSHLVDALLKRRCKVTVLDDFSTGKTKNLEHVKNEIKIIRGGVENFRLVKKAVAGCEVIFHEAALSLLQSIEDPVRNAEVNVIGTLNLLEAARECKRVKVFVHASTGSVYGEPQRIPQDEDHPLEPVSPYGVAKLAAERYVSLWHKLYGVKTTILRYFNVYGPRKDYGPRGGVTEIFIKNILMGKPITIEWDGLQQRSFTYVDDVVDATISAAEVEGAHGNVFNIGNPTLTSVKELAQLAMELCGKNVRIRYAPKREGDVRKVAPDISRAKKVLNYRPRVKLREGLLKEIAWMKRELGK